jgi:hypothetical protein
MLKNIGPKRLHFGRGGVSAGAICLLHSEFDPTTVKGMLLSSLGTARTN